MPLVRWCICCRFLVGMMPGKLNEGEQDFIDRMRLAQMREAPTRVRYTWENDQQRKSRSAWVSYATG